MATAQQLLDLKYDRQLIEDRARLSELFSEDILGALYRQHRDTMASILATIDLSISYQNDFNTSFKGLHLLTNLESLGAGNNGSGDMNISSLVNLKTIDLFNSYNLTSIGSLLNLVELEGIWLTNAPVQSIGSIRNSVKLIEAYFNGCQLDTIDVNFSTFTSLETLNVADNAFSTSVVNSLLNSARSALAANPALPLQTLNLGGSTMGIPTGGASNADYVWLLNNGVTVTIRTT
jgi:hypothetical protein